MWWFTADEHYGHGSIIQYANRPFGGVEEMDTVLVENHNKVVGKGDVVVHAGDFCLVNKKGMEEYAKQLNGTHIWIRGNHDHWMGKDGHEIWCKTIEGIFVCVCHYPMRSWPSSCYNSWQLFGHVHGRMVLESKQYDVGVDNNGYYPVSWERLKEIMSKKPDNVNKVTP
jgi:calcineurin-like phosphoesterase family protein